ncbi:MAG: hypothetical protein IMW91_03755 [Firmicutes bacterium]|nr:hypothetical protein [Bacillota bacterium]
MPWITNGVTAFAYLAFIIFYSWYARDGILVEHGYLYQFLSFAALAALVVMLGRGWLRRTKREGQMDYSLWLTHGMPALIIGLVPVGSFEMLVGMTHPIAYLDFPQAKLLAAVWFGVTLLRERSGT